MLPPTGAVDERIQRRPDRVEQVLTRRKRKARDVTSLSPLRKDLVQD
jgi:hypothetical protein